MENIISYIFVVVAIVVLAISITINLYDKGGDRISYCESNGYDGYKDVSEPFEPTKYKCVKKVSVGVGYKYEYSGYID